jgi:Mn2+/Fe2+ NRAMP family transporter
MQELTTLASSPHPDLIKITEIFLIPSSFMVAALGTADTNFHRAAVSILGLIVSVLWWVCSREAISVIEKETDPGKPKYPRRTAILSWLAVVFVFGWTISTVAHLILWDRPLGK